MKTKEEVLVHLRRNGYTDEARAQIAVFMTGMELKEHEEVIVVKKGDMSFNDFYMWFNSEDEYEEPQCENEVLSHFKTLFVLALLIDDKDLRDQLLKAIDFFAERILDEEDCEED